MQSTSMMVFAAALVVPMQAPRAQNVTEKSHSSGLFIGGGVEGTGVFWASAGGPGGLGLSGVVGYGLTPRWSLYTEWSGAEMMSENGVQAYSLTHLDVGARVHFRTGPHTVVPFAQAALAGRAFSPVDSGAAGRGVGVSFGGGLNAYFTPSLAFTGALTFTNGMLDNVPRGTFFISVTDGSSAQVKTPARATSARLYLGLLWVRPHT